MTLFALLLPFALLCAADDFSTLSERRLADYIPETVNVTQITLALAVLDGVVDRSADFPPVQANDLLVFRSFALENKNKERAETIRSQVNHLPNLEKPKSN